MTEERVVTTAGIEFGRWTLIAISAQRAGAMDMAFMATLIAVTWFVIGNAGVT